MAYPIGSRQFAFTVPAGAGSYATEVLYTNADLVATKSLDWFDKFVLFIAQLTAVAAVELDLLKPGADPNGGDSSYFLLVSNQTTAGYKGNLTSAGWWGARLRAKSGGTAGSTIVGVQWGTN